MPKLEEAFKAIVYIPVGRLSSEKPGSLQKRRSYVRTRIYCPFTVPLLERIRKYSRTKKTGETPALMDQIPLQFRVSWVKKRSWQRYRESNPGLKIELRTGIVSIELPYWKYLKLNHFAFAKRHAESVSDYHEAE
jgi:hypothetical protein